MFAHMVQGRDRTRGARCLRRGHDGAHCYGCGPVLRLRTGASVWPAVAVSTLGGSVYCFEKMEKSVCSLGALFESLGVQEAGRLP